MPLHFAARMHAKVHGLFRPKDEAETRALFEEVRDRYRQHNLDTVAARSVLISETATWVRGELGLAPSDLLARPVEKFVARLFEYEALLAVPAIDWTQKRSTSEWWAIRDELLAHKELLADFDVTTGAIENVLIAALSPLIGTLPQSQHRSPSGRDLSVPVQLLQGVETAARVVEPVLVEMLSRESAAPFLFPRLASQLQANVNAISAKNPLDSSEPVRQLILPGRSSLKDPVALVDAYLGRTPLADLFKVETTVTIPEEARFEHCHIVGGSGHGKSQTLQYLIANDLEVVAAGERSIIVLDSQGDLIRNIANLAEFGPGGSLHDRVVIIDPSDVEWPVSLNLFDVGIERLAGYDPLERERLTNSILELYDFVLGSLLSAEMTQKQNVIFRYVTRLMLHIPDATIHTLRELMEPGSEKVFAPHIDKLTGTAKRFFETEFTSREFEQTKKQVMRRLWGILENQTFERMFSHPRSKLDLFSEINSGKVILINTAKDLLKEQGSEIFGRFFIALIAQAAQERATLPENKRLPTYVYIDEAADYFDRNIGTILAQARKFKVGMVLAHQYLGQLDARLQDAFAANTSIKLAGGVSSKDARTLAPMLHCDPAVIEMQPKGSFAGYIRGVTPEAASLRFPFGYLEAKDRMTTLERTELQDRMRERYAVHHSSLEAGLPEEEEQEDATSEDSEPEPKHTSKQDDVDTTPGESW